MAKNCYCIIKHAITDVERQQVNADLDRAIKIGDKNGVILAMAQLGDCPSNKTEVSHGS